MDCLLACLSKKRLEVLHTIFVVETHGGNGRSDAHPQRLRNALLGMMDIR